MDLELLRLFAQVAEAGSLSKPALVLGTAQSVISRRIATLERELGGHLFHRTGRGVALTEIGRRILPRVRTLLVEAERLADDVRGAAGSVAGDVRMGMLTSMAHPLVGDLCRIVRTQHPNVRLHFLEGTGGQLEEWLAAGRIDIGILPARRENTSGPEALLRRISLCLVGPIGDSVTQKPTVRFARLHMLPLVLPAAPSALQRVLQSVAKRRKVTLSLAMEADSLTIQKEIAAIGGAYTVLGAHATVREVREGRLQSSRIVDPVIERDIVLVTAGKNALTPAAREVAGIVRRLAGASSFGV